MEISFRTWADGLPGFDGGLVMRGKKVGSGSPQSAGLNRNIGHPSLRFRAKREIWIFSPSQPVIPSKMRDLKSRRSAGAVGRSLKWLLGTWPIALSIIQSGSRQKQSAGISRGTRVLTINLGGNSEWQSAGAVGWRCG